jgi:hypothetical protein
MQGVGTSTRKTAHCRATIAEISMAEDEGGTRTEREQGITMRTTITETDGGMIGITRDPGTGTETTDTTGIAGAHGRGRETDDRGRGTDTGSETEAGIVIGVEAEGETETET